MKIDESMLYNVMLLPIQLGLPLLGLFSGLMLFPSLPPLALSSIPLLFLGQWIVNKWAKRLSRKGYSIGLDVAGGGGSGA